MDPITEKSKEGTITVKFTDSTINEEDPTEIQDPQLLLHRKQLFLAFLVMVYGRVDNGDKLSENFGFGRPHFHATGH